MLQSNINVCIFVQNIWNVLKNVLSMSTLLIFESLHKEVNPSLLCSKSKRMVNLREPM